MFLLLTTNSCIMMTGNPFARSEKLSPAMTYKNFSENGETVKNVKVIWSGTHLRTGDMGRCSDRSEIFGVYKYSDFFGHVHAEWENAKGEKLTKDFVFKKEDLPSYKTRYKRGVYVILYFSQTDLEYYTSDNPNIEKIKEEKSGNWLLRYIEGKGKQCVNDPKEKKRIDALYQKYGIN